jgi:hypothetical protein
VEQQMSGRGLTGGYEVVARYHDAPAAEAAAEKLVLRGMGAMVEHRADDEAEHVVVVVAGDEGRAREILGVAPPDEADQPVMRPPKTSGFWIALVFLAAMILLPLIAFYVSFKLAGG